MKNISFKVEDSVLDRLNYYRDTVEGGRLSQADFVKDAIQEKCEKTQLLRMGNVIISFPNPDNNIMTDKQKNEVLDILKETDLKLSRIAPGVVQLTELILYYQYHFINMTEKQRKTFKDNLIMDSRLEKILEELEVIE